MAQKSEAAYCSGGGSTANTPQELVYADLTAIDRCMAFNPAFAIPHLEDLYELGTGFTPSASIYTHSPPGTGEGKFYFQTSVLYDWAVSGSYGGLPTSKAFRFYDGDSQKDIYGCVVSKYTLEAIPEDFAYQTVEWVTAQQKVTGCSNIDPAIPSHSSATPYSIHGMTATLDGKLHSALNIRKIKLDLINTLDLQSFQLGSYYLANPTLKKRNWNIEIECTETNSNTWFSDTMNTTNQLVDLVLGFGVFTLTCSNFKCSSTNQSNLEGPGMILRKYSFKESVGATIVKS